MNLLKIKLWTLNFIGFLTANPIFAYLLFGAIIFTLVFGYIGSCRSRIEERKDKQNQVEIQKEKGRIEILEEQRNAAITNNEAAAEQSNKANANFDRVLGTDSNQRDGNFSAVRKRWCEDHPADSKCKPK